MKLLALLVLAGALAPAQTPPDVLRFFQTAAENLADEDEQAFLNHFDPKMDGFAGLRDDVRTLLAARNVASAIEFTKDEGDARQRSVELDWVFTTSEKMPPGESVTRRIAVKCQIERQGKQWKIVRFEPLGLFAIK